MANITLGNITSVPVTKSTLVPSSIFTTTDVEPTVKTGSVMSRDTNHCSLEKCAKEHYLVVIFVFSVNLLIIIILILCVKRNCSNKTSKKDIEATKLSTHEKTDVEQSGEQSPTAISPMTAHPRKPLPLPPPVSRQASSAGAGNSTYLEIISDDNFDYRERSIGNSPSGTPGSRRALIPPTLYRKPTTPQPSSSMNNTTDDYEISSYLQPRDGLRIHGTGPYAELSYGKRESRTNSATKSKGYLGLNSLTRIRTKIKRKRTES